MFTPYARGAAQTYARLKVANMWERTAPLRAGLTVGGAVALPTAGAMYAADTVDPQSELSDKERAAVSGIGGAFIGAPMGHMAYAIRDQDGKNLRSVAEQTAANADKVSPNVGRAAVDDFVAKHPQHPVRGGGRVGGREHVYEGTAADIADELKTDKSDIFSSLMGSRSAETDARRRAARGLESDIYGAVARGLRGEQPKPAAATPAESLLERLRADKPGITDRDLQRMLHPDRAARMGFDPAVAQEAFVNIGRSPAVDPFADAVAMGTETARQRADVAAQLQKMRERMFTGGKARTALTEALQRAYG